MYKKLIRWITFIVVFVALTSGRWNVPIAYGEGAITASTSDTAQPSTSAGATKLDFSTFIGGSLADMAQSIAVDALGNAYITGQTNSDDFAGLMGDRQGVADAFVAKINADRSLGYVVFLGGSNADSGTSIALDAAGNAYIAGWTNSTDFPVKLAADNTYGGEQDAFVAKITPSGDIAFATFIGGSNLDEGRAIAVHDGQIFITGFTDSPNFIPPAITGSAFDNQLDELDAFVSILDSAGTTIDYATYLGGSGEEVGADIAVDSMGTVYVSGTTFSTDFPTTMDVFDDTFENGDGFLTKFVPNVPQLQYSTLIGGLGVDQANALAIDTDGHVYVTGSTQSTDFPIKPNPGAFDTDHNGAEDAFVMKIDPSKTSGDDLIFATYIGGLDFDVGLGIVVDTDGFAYIAGATASDDFPATPYAPFANSAGSQDAFIAKVSTDGQGAYVSFLGGSNFDVGNDIALDSAGAVYVTGETQSANFASLTALFPTFQGSRDAFVTKFTPITPTTSMVDMFIFGMPESTVAADEAVNVWVAYGNAGDLTASGVTVTANLDARLTYLSHSSGVTPAYDMQTNTLTWVLPGLGYLERGRFRLRVLVPDVLTAPDYPIVFTVAANSSEANPDLTPNTYATAIKHNPLLFFPVILR